MAKSTAAKSTTEKRTTTKTKAASTTATRAKSAGAKKSTRAKPQLSDDQIRQRAYEVYLRNGMHPGNDLDNWLEAERELLATAP